MKRWQNIHICSNGLRGLQKGLLFKEELARDTSYNKFAVLIAVLELGLLGRRKA
jgi:hypothetical protein